MSPWTSRVCLFAPIIVVLALATAAQTGSKLLQKSSPPDSTQALPLAADPLGRETPSGTIFGFLRAAQLKDYKTAARYLQISASRRLTQGEELTSKLNILLNQGSVGVLLKVSSLPEGNAQEGVPPDRQNVGTLVAGDGELPLTLVRVSDPTAGKIWLISSDTLEKVPEFYDQLEMRQLEGHLPAFLVQNFIFGMAVWQWLAILLAIPVAVGIAWLLLRTLSLPWNLWLRYRQLPGPSGGILVSGPLWLLAAALVHVGLVLLLGLPLLDRHYYALTARVIVVVALVWLFWRITGGVMRRLRGRAISFGKTGAGTLMLLGERILKALVLIGGVFTFLSVLGFNLTTVLAGLGIGGIALAFAAQKTLENLFGGISVLGDEVIRIGDVCQFGDRVGEVEDISLRSTRIRTVERTELYIPNGALATMNVENLTRRDKILFNSKIALRYETSASQLQCVLAEVRSLLFQHPKIESVGARVGFVGFEKGTLTFEIFSYALTSDFIEFTSIREELFLRIMEIVDQSGTGLAPPATPLDFNQEAGLDRAKTKSV
jgi:MscS family membrane protein